MCGVVAEGSVGGPGSLTPVQRNCSLALVLSQGLIHTSLSSGNTTSMQGTLNQLNSFQ